MERKISVKIELMGSLVSKVKKMKPLWEFQDGITVKEILTKKFGFKVADLKYLITNVNEKSVEKDAVLNDGDTLKVFMIIGGG